MSTQPIPYRRNVPLGVISIELASEALKNEYKDLQGLTHLSFDRKIPAFKEDCAKADCPTIYIDMLPMQTIRETGAAISFLFSMSDAGLLQPLSNTNVIVREDKLTVIFFDNAGVEKQKFPILMSMFSFPPSKTNSDLYQGW